ncbi:Rieske 2Fe-2S domain-containing protein [Pseudomonas sp. nanlin1]|uniref:Rieske 2Fe-2S domain-containing protein n=1 Tax=Pseudomonas sp. nanlin1 TaxID=3040605 RepID=UPI00388E9FDA
MKAISLNISQANYIAVAQKTYFLKRHQYSTQLLPTTCPHRGGPLHMGEVTADGQSVICPWHDKAYKVCNLEKKSLPTVRVRNQISTVIGATERCVPLLKISRYD